MNKMRAEMTMAERAADDCDSIARAHDFAPFIYGGATVAVFGGLVGISGKTRKTAAGIAALLFVAI